LLDGIISETIDIIKPLANEHKILLEFRESPVNLLHVEADRQKLKQVLLNLVNNAVKYNHEGGSVCVECTAQIELQNSEPEAAGTGQVIRIKVIDTGNGIASGELSKLFNPFERIGAEISEVEGTGLGLAVSKKLMEAIHGKIGVESEFGKGSTFWIELPQSESQLEMDILHDDPNEIINKNHLVNGTLLYIEDNHSNIDLVEQIMNVHRPSIRLITNMYGKNAVKFATDYKPDLILLDLDLPDMKGDDVIKLLQQDEITRSIPVVILSADAMQRKIDALMKAGAKDFMTKPLDVVKFLRVIDGWMKNEG
jgi:CheY-like chemotaxis protein